MQALLAFVKNLDQRNMPPGMTIPKFLKLLNRKMGATMSSNMEEDEWNIMWVGGMWFQDLWTYDFRRTEMCVIPYATQEGEISFCAYNTGVGWRKNVENMHMVAETAIGSATKAATRFMPVIAPWRSDQGDHAPRDPTGAPSRNGPTRKRLRALAGFAREYRATERG